MFAISEFLVLCKYERAKGQEAVELTYPFLGKCHNARSSLAMGLRTLQQRISELEEFGVSVTALLMYQVVVARLHKAISSK